MLYQRYITEEEMFVVSILEEHLNNKYILKNDAKKLNDINNQIKIKLTNKNYEDNDLEYLRRCQSGLKRIVDKKDGIVLIVKDNTIITVWRLSQFKEKSK